jgi:glycine/D-amino acid oxidase-like deaminating enzyme
VTIRTIAVLGAGILGSCLALMLARGGARVVLFDERERPVEAASRWNEGKLHLGYLYAADPGLSTARHVLPGSLCFLPIMEDLLASDLSAAVAAEDDLFLIHRDSVVAPDAAAAVYRAVDALVAGHPDAAAYPGEPALRPVRRIPHAPVTDSPAIVAAFRVPERSVNTRLIADRLAAAVLAEPRITFRGSVRIAGAAPPAVLTRDGREGGFSAIVNALWNGRLAVDRTAGLADPPVWSQRYRLAVFLRTHRPATLPGRMIATGPFGDIKNYNGRDFYLSWYPAGLMSDETAADPAPPADPDRAAVLAATLAGLRPYIPGLADLLADAAEMVVEGGFVYAEGRGALSDPASGLHRRDRFGLRTAPGYVSADTGKYSSAPWLARRVADLLEGRA